MRWQAGLTIMPPPPGLQVWVVVVGDEAPDGPHAVLAIGFAMEGFSRSDSDDYFEEEIRDTAARVGPKFDYRAAHFYLQVDWEDPWIEHGDRCFFTLEAAQEQIEENARHQEWLAERAAREKAAIS